MSVRLRNKSTGVIVSVDESKRDRFGEGWEPVKVSAPQSKPVKDSVKRKRTSSK